MNKRTPHSPSRQAGIALVSVIFVMLTVLILTITFSFVAVSERRAANSNATVNTLVQAADTASERARIQITEAFQDNGFAEDNFLDTLREQLEGGTVDIPELHGKQTLTVGSTPVKWEIRDISPADSATGWVEVAATAETAQGAQTVIRKIGFSSPDIFDLALLTETVNCMFCHLKVNGDVGTLSHLRPGWGQEGVSGIGSGAGLGGSTVNGNLYAAGTITADDTADTDGLHGDVDKINGAIINGFVEQNSTNRRLPADEDGDGIADFPPINRDTARDNARGSLKMNTGATDGAMMRGVPLNGTVGSSGALSTSNLGTINRTYNGHIIMRGTAANPIDLSEDIFVEGDVIIAGVVKGIGSIYAGRNIYIADDVVMANGPDKPGEGICNGVSDPDECARINIDQGRDALRLGARGSIIVGDYTEYENGSTMPWSRRQSADFYRAQFGFGWSDRHYDKTTGDELTKTTDENGNSIYVNVDGTVISSGDVKTLKAQMRTPESQAEGYDYSFKPGHIKSNGDFHSWLKDDLYREFMGTENYDHNTWRWSPNLNRPSNWWDYMTAADFVTEMTNSFQTLFDASRNQDNYVVQDPTAREDVIENRIINPADILAIYANRNNHNTYLPIRDITGDKLGEVHIQSSGGNPTFRVMMEDTAIYETQVNRVEAFLYANKRIAGKTSMQGVAVNGGMIAQELGVLAQGRRLIWPWNDPGKERCDPNDASTSIDMAYFVEDTDDCALTVNYDHRLRNGGWGFGLVQNQPGKTLSWKLADQESEKVQ